MAETLGATWTEASTPDYALGWETPGAGRTCWELRDAESTPLCWCFSGGVHQWSVRSLGLPRYLNDPAAWGALQEKERVVPIPFPNAWRGMRPDHTYGPTERSTVGIIPAGIQIVGAYTDLLPTIGEAVCAAVLAKHGIDWDTLEPVR